MDMNEIQCLFMIKNKSKSENLSKPEDWAFTIRMILLTSENKKLHPHILKNKTAITWRKWRTPADQV